MDATVLGVAQRAVNEAEVSRDLTSREVSEILAGGIMGWSESDSLPGVWVTQDGNQVNLWWSFDPVRLVQDLEQLVARVREVGLAAHYEAHLWMRFIELHPESRNDYAQAAHRYAAWLEFECCAEERCVAAMLAWAKRAQTAESILEAFTMKLSSRRFKKGRGMRAKLGK